jgi:Fe-S-cluster containining protein
VSWYANGLRFECTRCGRCCTGAAGYVWVDTGEIAALAALRGLSLDDFGRTYLRRVGSRYALLDRAGGDCVFHDGGACTVYAARPAQCRSFPFWPKNLASPQAWQAAASQCEGIRDDAALFPAEAIDALASGPR